jgi:transglutaminase-like putative cysteine protease
MTGARATGLDLFFEFSLLGMLASGYLAIAGSGHLDLPSVVAGGAALAFRGLIALGRLRAVTDRIVTAAILLYAVFYPIDYGYLSRDFLAATVHLVFFLTAVLLLTARANRQYFLLALLAFLQMLAACLLSANATFFLCLTAFLVFGVATLMAGEVRRSSAPEGSVARAGWRGLSWRLTGATLFAGAAILTITGALFFFLPRTARAAFQHLIPQRMVLPGFSNEVQLGQIGQIQMSTATLMHVYFEERGPQPPLKWRGSALHEFDGRRWSNPSSAAQPVTVSSGQAFLADREQLARPGRRIGYDVNLSGAIADTLFFAGVPEFVTIDTRLLLRLPNGAIRLGFTLPQGVRYSARSLLDAAGPSDASFASAGLSGETLRACLRLPAMDARVAELARRVAGGLASEADKALALQRYLQSEYGYTLELPVREPADPIAYFLFERRRGHCEYFASAMAVLLRSIQIPSRVVTGFQGGIYNPISGWHLVRAADAHSWVEAYLAGSGWVTFDPTPAGPPPEGGFWLTLSLYADAAETFWQNWVLGYDLERQASLADRVGQSGRTLPVDRLSDWIQRAGAAARESAGVAAAIATLAFLVAAWLLFGRARWARWWMRRRQMSRMQRGEMESSDAALLYRRALEALRRCGFEKPEWMTPAEFAGVLPGELAPLATEVTKSYNALRFGGRLAAAPRLLFLLEQLERAPQRTVAR